MTIILGLTGSIGMGKSTVAQQFADEGAVVSDADAIVHQLLAGDESTKQAIFQHFPLCREVATGAIDRRALGREVFADAAKLRQLEQILHPRVRAAHEAAIKQARKQHHSLLVLEIPLLYETGAESICDAVVVVTARPEIQRQRVLARANMTPEKFEQILAQQLPDDQKRARADFVIDTSDGLESSRAQLQAILSKL